MTKAWNEDHRSLRQVVGQWGREEEVKGPTRTHILPNFAFADAPQEPFRDDKAVDCGQGETG